MRKQGQIKKFAGLCAWEAPGGCPGARSTPHYSHEVEGALNRSQIEHKPPGEGRGMLKGLQETTGSQRQGCSPPLLL